MSSVLNFPVATFAARPMPPASLAESDDFAPDQPGLGAWVRENFIDSDGPLHNPRHAHLEDAQIGWLWTTAVNLNRDREVAGECRMIGPVQRKWGSALSQWHLRQMFGMVPDFVITLSAPFCETADDWSFCALIEHELCHAAQDIDAFGDPRFDREGNPMFRLISHDVEQFTDVVERYGSAASGVDGMVRAAQRPPLIGTAKLAAACGSCGRMAA